MHTEDQYWRDLPLSKLRELCLAERERALRNPEFPRYTPIRHASMVRVYRERLALSEGVRTKSRVASAQ